MTVEATLDAVADTLAAEGLRPIVDSDLAAVHADCPDCRAGERDPLALWRPLTVVPSQTGARASCQACGSHHG